MFAHVKSLNMVGVMNYVTELRQIHSNSQGFVLSTLQFTSMINVALISVSKTLVIFSFTMTSSWPF